MVAFLFGDPADTIHKIQSRLEIRKSEAPEQVVVIHHGPVRDLRSELGALLDR